MSRKQRDILEGLRKIGRQPMATYAGIASSVGDEYCTVEVDGFANYQVRLRASVDGVKNKSIVYPKAGSWVLITRIEEGDDFFVSMVSEVERIVLIDETFGGLVKVEELVNRLNAIENAFNSFLNEYKIHIHSVNVAGAVTVSLTPPSTLTNLDTTTQEQLENEKIKHG